ncbi:MAG: RIO1 family regulatory kinase/ATPase [Trueperaceae bacterium]
MKRINVEEGDLEYHREIRHRKNRSKRRAHRSSKELYLKEEEKTSTESKFAHPDLQALHLRGYVDEILSELKSGKEATVYLGENHLDGERNLVAVKVYKDLEARSFKNDSIYRQGRSMGGERNERAVNQRSKFGLATQQKIWTIYEYTQLWQLYNAGIPVPRPLVGPAIQEIEASGRIVLMEWLGTEDAPAPRLSDLKLEPSEAQVAFDQSVSLLKRMLQLGKVHGDFSTYNLLYWQNKVIVIDVPQMVDVETNKNAKELLERDVRSLCMSFKKLGVQADPVNVLRQIQHKG